MPFLYAAFKKFGFACLFTSTVCSLAQADDWNRFRGPNGSGVATELKLSTLGEKSIRWKKELPSGSSSPIIHDGKLLLTSFKGEDRTVHCLNLADGSEVWTHNVKKLRSEAATPPNSPATCGLACDGQRILAFFPDAGLVALSLDGKQLWLKDLGPFSSMHGLSASPILYQDMVFLSVDQLADPYIVAMDAKTGTEKWRTERLLGVTGGYSTPTLLNVESKVYLLSASPGELVAYDVQSGQRAASIEGLANAPVATPVVVGDRVYYNEPPGEPIPMSALGNADKNKDGVIETSEVAGSVGASRLIKRIDEGFGNKDGAVSEAEWDKAFGTFLNKGGMSCIQFRHEGSQLTGSVVWKYTKSVPYIPSVLVTEEIAYLINDGGILLAFDRQSGNLVQRGRVGEAAGQYYASPVAGGDKLVLASLDGKLTHVQLGKQFEIKETFSLEEPIVATPTIHNGLLYVRSEKHLICFGDS